MEKTHIHCTILTFTCPFICNLLYWTLAKFVTCSVFGQGLNFRFKVAQCPFIAGVRENELFVNLDFLASFISWLAKLKTIFYFLFVYSLQAWFIYLYTSFQIVTYYINSKCANKSVSLTGITKIWFFLMLLKFNSYSYILHFINQ